MNIPQTADEARAYLLDNANEDVHVIKDSLGQMYRICGVRDDGVMLVESYGETENPAFVPWYGLANKYRLPVRQ